MFVDYIAIGQWIKQVRKQKGYTQERLAENLGISTVYISQIENGKTKLNLEMLLRISYLLTTEPGFFLTGATYQSAENPHSDIARLIDACPPEKRKLLIEIIKAALKNL